MVPKSRLGLHPSEMLYGRSFLRSPGNSRVIDGVHIEELNYYICSIIRKYFNCYLYQHTPLVVPITNFNAVPDNITYYKPPLNFTFQAQLTSKYVPTPCFKLCEVSSIAKQLTRALHDLLLN